MKTHVTGLKLLKKQLLSLITTKIGNVLSKIFDIAKNSLEEWHTCLSMVIFSCTNGEAN